MAAAKTIHVAKRPGRHKQFDEPRRHLGVHVPESMLTRLSERAAKERRSISAQILHYVDRGLTEDEPEQ